MLLNYKDEWDRYRRTYEGGRQFVDTYLKKYGVRETQTMFDERKSITYCPGFAGAAVDEINNTIFSRMPDVSRLAKSNTYNSAILGQNYGVDYRGTSIDSFIGCNVLPELTVMGRVGVYVDMPRDVPSTGKDLGTHPYFYIYPIEDIISWTNGLPGSGHEYTKLLLRDNYYNTDEDNAFGLVTSMDDRYRLLEVVDGGVKVTFLDDQKEEISSEILDLPKIPFVMLSLKHSLLKNVADYQIALLNIESTDVDFARKANFPVYVEEGNFLHNLPATKPEEQETDTPDSGEQERQSGTTHGIRYPKGARQPDFINPSSEPMQANIAKEEKLKQDIRLLVHLNVASLGTKSESRESKDFDREGLENGLSYISVVLEEGERKLAQYWAEYENKTDKSVTISYPRNFDLRTDEDRRQEAEAKIKLSKAVSSDTFQREILKQVVDTLMSGKVAPEVLSKMKKEIDTAKSLTADPKIILADLEAGLVTQETASVVRGYDKEEAEKAKKEKAERMEAIAQSQGGEVGAARGNPDFQDDETPTSADEKAGKKQRGEGKLDG